MKVPLQYAYGDHIQPLGEEEVTDQKNRARLGWIKACRKGGGGEEWGRVGEELGEGGVGQSTYSHNKGIYEDGECSQLNSLAHQCSSQYGSRVGSKSKLHNVIMSNN